MEGLVVMLSLLLGAVLATAVSMAGLRLITSFVPGPDDGDGAEGGPTQDERPRGAARPATS